MLMIRLKKSNKQTNKQTNIMYNDHCYCHLKFCQNFSPEEKISNVKIIFEKKEGRGRFLQEAEELIIIVKIRNDDDNNKSYDDNNKSDRNKQYC